MLEPGVTPSGSLSPLIPGGGVPEEMPGLFPVSSATQLLLCCQVNVFTVWVCPPGWGMVRGNSPGPGRCIALGQHVSPSPVPKQSPLPAPLPSASSQACPALQTVSPNPELGWRRYSAELTRSWKLDVEASSVTWPLLRVCECSELPLEKRIY